tara:strand:+ start:19684 stop:20313 length:630 start_codon:yes stop_codon:yes gene_type:complete
MSDNHEQIKMFPGAMLQHAREAKKLSIDDVSATLHLGKKILQELESDTYRAERGLTFMKGYLRTYAKFLGINEAEIMQAFQTLGVEAEVPEKKRKLLHDNAQQKALLDHKFGKLIYPIVIIVIILLLLWWYGHRASPDSIVKPMLPATVSQPVVAPTLAPAVSSAQMIAPQLASRESVAPQLAPSESVAPQATPPAQNDAVTSQLQMDL